ncbi:MAG: MBL fold metallo-hydrolase [Cyclobacteriaceae bacterium]|nr:MBL fold metallo-hydrolase [Cyclobacteriaceae bacterium]
MRVFVLLILLAGCNREHRNQAPVQRVNAIKEPSLVILGTVQDAGSPHIGCRKNCCNALFENPDPTRMVVSLGIVDPKTNQRWIIEATPDLPRQLNVLNEFAGVENKTPDGILLTHAHIGHYAGLMYLGREAMNTDRVPVYALPRMKNYLETNGPWSQLVNLKNITLIEIRPEEKIQLSPALSITPVAVPHRDEFTETAGYLIEGPLKKVLFIPDIDKWEKWDKNIAELIKTVDYAFLDATFFDGEEIQTRNLNEIPHPFVVESISLFNQLPVSERNKIHFIHLNHTNPLLNPAGKAYKKLHGQGYKVARYGTALPL